MESIIIIIIFFIPDTADMLIHTEVHIKESTYNIYIV